MHKSLLFKPQNPHLKPPLSPFFTIHKKMSISLPSNLYFQTPSSLSLKNSKTHLRIPIVCARRKKKFPILGSAKSRKELFVSAYYIASKLKILPEPLDFMIREFAVGNGGGSGSGGGSGWWNGNKGSGGFDGWGRRRKKGANLKFWGCFVILVTMMVLVLKTFGEDLGIGEVLGLSLFGVLVNGWWANGLKDWALGFCCCVVLFVWVFKRREIEKFVKDYGVVKIVGRRRNNNRSFQRMIQNISRKLS